MISLVLAAVFFVGIHVFVSGTSLRAAIVAKTGEVVYQTAFSLVSLLGLIWLGFVTLIAVLAPLISPEDPFSIVGQPFLPPFGEYLFGTDSLGRSMLAGLVHGSRTSLLIAIIATLSAVVVGALIGALAGYYGKLVDDGLMRMQKLNPGYQRSYIPAGSYPGQDKQVATIGYSTHLIAQCSLSEDTVYNVLKSIHANVADMAAIATTRHRENTARSGRTSFSVWASLFSSSKVRAARIGSRKAHVKVIRPVLRNRSNSGT